MLGQNSHIMKYSEYSLRRKGQHLSDAKRCKIIKIYQANQLKNEEICKLFSISAGTYMNNYHVQIKESEHS